MDEFIQLAHQHAWAPLSILVMLWLYRVLAGDSKFPITWPEKYAKWKPAMLIALGQVICVVKAIVISHVAWYVAMTNGFIIGFMALGGVHILKLWWPVDGSEPKWLRMFVLAFDEVIPILVTIVPQEKPKAMMLDEDGLPTLDVPPEPVTKKELPKS